MWLSEFSSTTCTIVQTSSSYSISSSLLLDMVLMSSSVSSIVTSRFSTRPLFLVPTSASLPWQSSPSSSPKALQRPSPFLSPHHKALSFSSSSSLCSTSSHSSPNRNSARVSAGGGWFSAFGAGKKKSGEFYGDIVKAGDPVLHEPAREVAAGEIASDAVQKTIDDMIAAMRKAPGVGLAAPQIGSPLQIIVLEDTKEYVSYVTKRELEAQDRRPFDLLVIINPKIKKKGNKTALFFEGCLSVDGYRAIVERHLEVEVTGLDRNGSPIKVDATGWQARILQHECDHLEGTVYVDKMLPRTFRTVENLGLPLPAGCPKLGPC